MTELTKEELIDKLVGAVAIGQYDHIPKQTLAKYKVEATEAKNELLSRLGAAVSASPQPRPWFLIETAPKDGRHIQAADFRPGQVGFGGNPQQAYQCIVHWFEWGDGTHTEESGFYPSTGAGENPPITNLTHWKPLEEFFAAAPAQEPRPANQIPPAYCETHDTVHKCENVIAEAQEQPVENSPQGPTCLGYPDCDGMLPGEEHEKECPLVGTFGPPSPQKGKP